MKRRGADKEGGGKSDQQILAHGVRVTQQMEILIDIFF
jgi:hypothetical protein